MGRKIIVIGSSNMDMVVQTDHIPVPGETILSDAFFMNAGGKGANQAVAVARLGGDVAFISKLGDDLFGRQFAELFSNEGIDISHLLTDKQLPTGTALITVDRAGENSIVVASGANAGMKKEDLDNALDSIASADIVLVQLEIPMAVVEFVAEFAASKGVKVILNPAPAAQLSSDLLKHIDIITPNETEAAKIAGLPVTDPESAKTAARKMLSMGAKSVIITMGPLGALVCANGGNTLVTAKKTKAVDTTAAGDVFNGALAVALSEGKSMLDAVRFACDAATISVARMGAQASIPYRKEL